MDPITAPAAAGLASRIIGWVLQLVGLRRRGREEDRIAVIDSYERRIKLAEEQIEAAQTDRERDRLRSKVEDIRGRFDEYLEQIVRERTPAGAVKGEPSRLPAGELEELRAAINSLSALHTAQTFGEHFLRGNAFYQVRAFNKALEEYNAALQLKPDDPIVLNNLGVTLDELARYDEALADHNRALELSPDYPEILSNRGMTLRKLERYDDALADFSRSLELRPDDPVTLNNRGVTLGYLQRYDEALADFNRSLELRPNDPVTLHNRGMTLGNLQRYDEALADFNRSLELRPGHPDTFGDRGVTLGALERHEEALADYNRSLELTPDDPDTLYNRACVYSRMGQIEKSLDDLKEAISRDAKYRAMAHEDEDFDNLRSDPEFGPEFERLVAEPEE